MSREDGFSRKALETGLEVLAESIKAGSLAESLASLLLSLFLLIADSQVSSSDDAFCSACSLSWRLVLMRRLEDEAAAAASEFDDRVD